MVVEENIKISVLNENLIAAEILDWVEEKGPKAMGIAFALVFFILVVDPQYPFGGHYLPASFYRSGIDRRTHVRF